MVVHDAPPSFSNWLWRESERARTQRNFHFTNTAIAAGSKKINGKIREYSKDEYPALDTPIHMLAAPDKRGNSPCHG
jgi:hypothetical protein